MNDKIACGYKPQKEDNVLEDGDQSSESHDEESINVGTLESSTYNKSIAFMVGRDQFICLSPEKDRETYKDRSHWMLAAFYNAHGTRMPRLSRKSSSNLFFYSLSILSIDGLLPAVTSFLSIQIQLWILCDDYNVTYDKGYLKGEKSAREMVNKQLVST
ncbi:hypothetical protein L7F22_055312 [Adiantum nelumboides]|nr:hypothetical protein [Adiantum nelumboides]